MRTLQAVAVAGGLSLAAFGCHERSPAKVGTTDPGYPPSSEYEYEYEYDDDELADVEEPAPAPVVETPSPQVYADTSYAGPAYKDVLRDAGWTRIGDREVEGRRERGKIRVGRGDRHVSELVLLVDKAPVDIYDMTVMFDDGTSYSPPMTQRFRAGTRSRVIQLPAYHAPVVSILFRYGTLDPDGEAKIEVWGR